jgi:hypothetical protein
MNIFYLDHDPVKAAQDMVDKHVVKMILESSQLLSTAHRVIDGVEYIQINNNRKQKVWKLFDAREPILYKATHVNHPSTIWCRSTVDNYNWLVEHLYALSNEYTYRYEKKHKCSGELFYLLQSPPKNLTKDGFIEPPCAMPEEYITPDPVLSYRKYYRYGKTHLLQWKNRMPPEWIDKV